MTQRTKIEQDFLNDIDGVPGFHRRKDGKIEREVYEEQESNIGKSPEAKYYYLVEIISEDDYLIYMRDEIEEVERRDLGEYAEK